MRDSKDTGRDYLGLSTGRYTWSWGKKGGPRTHCKCSKQWSSVKSSSGKHRVRTLANLTVRVAGRERNNRQGVRGHQETEAWNADTMHTGVP